MSMRPIVRVQAPPDARPGQVVPVRVAIAHPMISGHQNDERGQRQARNIITHFECHGPDGLIFSMDLQPAIAANPSVQFWVRVGAGMVLRLRWQGDQGFVHEHRHEWAAA
jgi:sulfur-oxidizing protein SoxZ